MTVWLKSTSTYFATKTQAFGGRIAWAVSGDNSKPILSSRGRNVGDAGKLSNALFHFGKRVLPSPNALLVPTLVTKGSSVWSWDWRTNSSLRRQDGLSEICWYRVTLGDEVADVDWKRVTVRPGLDGLVYISMMTPPWAISARRSDCVRCLLSRTWIGEPEKRSAEFSSCASRSDWIKLVVLSSKCSQTRLAFRI